MRFLNPLLPKKWRKAKTVIPVVKLTGVIAEKAGLRPGLSLGSCAKMLEQAFTNKKAPAVAIVINSPGGSPVQSHLIYKRIRHLADKHDKKVLVFVEDVAASGGYMIAVAGDEIIADASSIVGSIGVIYAGFGFDKAIEKLGIDRRVYTAGNNKLTLDSFQKEKKADVSYLKSQQDEIHQHFIAMVKARREDKLKDDSNIFSGRFWVGSKALELGLIDGLGDLQGELQKRYGEDVRVKLISAGKNFFGRVTPGIQIDSLLDADNLLTSLEHRSIWSRFGL